MSGNFNFFSRHEGIKNLKSFIIRQILNLKTYNFSSYLQAYCITENLAYNLVYNNSLEKQSKPFVRKGQNVNDNGLNE